MADRKVPHYQMSKIRFSAYSAKEICQLSVVEVVNPESFDIIGHPTKGGLYDPAFGPCEPNAVCVTCGLNHLSCPGHVGHIALPLPVYNPFFFRTLYQLLKGSCFSCGCLLSSEIAVSLILAQLQALDYGLVGLAEELEEIISEEDNQQAKTLRAVIVKEKLEKRLAAAFDGMDIDEARRSAHVKNVVERRQKITKHFLKTYVMGGSKKCPRCRKTQAGLATQHNCRIVFTNTSRKNEAFKPKLKKKIQSINPNEDEIYDEIGDVNEDNENDDRVDGSEKQNQEYLTPNDARDHLRTLWKNEGALLNRLYGSVCNISSDDDCPADLFFLDVLPAPPARFRPLRKVNGMIAENPQSGNLKNVLIDTILVRELLKSIQAGSKTDLVHNVTDLTKSLIVKLYGKTLNEKLNAAWTQMQVHVNCVFDSDLDKLSHDKHPGVKQILEKKEGLFRKHMMGKRVNYAARSVISPDPFINVNEIGIPHVFASKLTYPQPVTPWNVEELKRYVINGPENYPGATIVKNEDGINIKLSRDIKQREAVAKQLLTPSNTLNKEHRVKIVYRHLKNGDVLLLNRQPTLHKPSIMAHKARVLPNEKTLRLHYANCKTYNADFDGDEMNAHFPQNELARAEAYNLALVDHQYLVPKDGTPLSGLIQDHVVSGTLMSIRGRFFNRSDYQRLVLSGLTFKKQKIKTLPPAIIKPEPLWSGKQVISTVIINVIPEGKALIHLNGKSKTSVKNWEKSKPTLWIAGGSPITDLCMTESEVIIRYGELLVGVLDKAQFGSSPYGLVHCCNELYGGSVSVLLLSSFSRLFTCFLQFHGFTLGVEDILITTKADKKRKKIIKNSTKIGDEVACEALNLDPDSDKQLITQKLQEAHCSKNDLKMKQWDMMMKQSTDEFNNKINQLCMPKGLLQTFPENNLQLMVQSGAKGSTVNAMQISGLLGQIELEGRRPPLMISGRSLPSFLLYETSPRAGGFVTGRFLTGIRPQEYFFHCMAGREGLVDTAVKTSRSGYLQRCLIKHLEGIVVNYDLTVRDSDGSVIQFLYGDDGLDIPKTQFLKRGQMSFLSQNAAAIQDKDHVNMIKEISEFKEIAKQKKMIRKCKKKDKPERCISSSMGFLVYSENMSVGENEENMVVNPNTGRSAATEKLINQWRSSDVETKASYRAIHERCPDPVVSKFSPDRNLSSVTESIDELITEYIDDNDTNISSKKFRDMVHMKTIRALCEPGESVGLLAAQSIGEPSTQMTLNTFHFAGRGEMNVTLGIPRLREILMVASENIATPTMVIPIHCGCEREAEELRLRMNRVYLSEVLQRVTIKETIQVKSRMERFRIYKLRFTFLPHKTYKREYYTNPSRNLQYFEKSFVKILTYAMKKKLHLITEAKFVSASSQRFTTSSKGKDENTPEVTTNEDKENVSTDDEGQEEGDATSNKLKEQRNEEQEYDENEEAEEASSESEDDDVEREEIVDSDDEDQVTKLRHEKQKELEESLASRKKLVLNTSLWIIDYKFDTKKEEWCEVTFQLRLQDSKLDIATIVEEEAKTAVLHQVPRIKKAITSPPDDKNPCLTVDGININEMFKYGHILDLNRLYSNHVHAIANSYGIEAAAKVIVKEIKNVFAVYGIEVDNRHLSLIADYMTFEGTYKPFNRIGMESNASPIQQMTFETTMHFLKSATLSGSEDQLRSPSSRLVVGKIVAGGTGCFDILQKPYNVDDLSKSNNSKVFSAKTERT